MNIPDPEKVIRRFPRTDDQDVLFMGRVRRKHPGPAYNPRYDGAWNPTDYIISSVLKHTKKRLRRLCRKHSLEDSGSRRKLMRRMYLHWRAAKMFIGTGEFYGYGPGYMNTRHPTCSCGFLSRKAVAKEQRRNEKLREMRSRQRHEIEQSMKRMERVVRGEEIMRFPRLRFPRLK